MKPFSEADCAERLKAVLAINFPKVKAEVLFVNRAHSRFIGIRDLAGNAIAEGTIRRGKAAVFEKGEDYPALRKGTIEEPGAVAVLTFVEIAPAFRGRGFGAAITRRLLSCAADWSVPAVYLHASFFDEDPSSYWERFGFVVIDDASEGHPYMRLDLAPGIMPPL